MSLSRTNFADESTRSPGTALDNSGWWAYDFANNRAAQWRASSLADRFCSGENRISSPCVHLNPTGDANRYLVFPALGSCCLCGSDANGFGVLRPDWVAQVNGTYDGAAQLTTPTFSGLADGWHAVGLQSNYYYQVPAGSVHAGAPLGIVQGTDDYMWFDPASFTPGPQADALFAKPAACNGAAQCQGLCQMEELLKSTRKA